MLCRVEMPANEQIFGRFYRYRMLRQRGGGRSSFMLMPLLVVLALVLTFGLGLSPWALAAVAVLVGGWLVFALVMRPARAFRSRGGAALQTEVTIFTETGYTRTVRSEEGGMPDNSSGSYAALTKAVETGRDFYLFTSPTQALLIDKEYFTKGDPAQLRGMLQKAMGKKFKGKKV